LKLQKKDKRYIGEILTNLGFVREKDIVAALSSQGQFPYSGDGYVSLNDPFFAQRLKLDFAWSIQGNIFKEK